ncbi:MAG TPA: hypothetical protein VGG74_09430 [Kofleriaceae bacterium]
MARCISLLIVLAACQGSSKLDAVRQGPAPHTRIQLDGELTEPAWNAVAVRGVFLGDDGGQARPYSELRILRDETHLYVALYAADQNIQSDDAFDVTVGALHAHLTAGGTATPATVRIAVDRDGTLDDPHDEDEEWVVESAMPLDELGPAPIAIKAKRCDVVKTGERRCGRWTGTIDPKIMPVIQ